MRQNSILKATLLFSAGFICALLGVVLAFSKGFVSPRWLGIVLLLLCIGGVIALFAVSRRFATAEVFNAAPVASNTTDPTVRKRRLFLIRFYQAWIVLLVVCLVSALGKAGSVPIAPLAVGVVVNLSIVAACLLMVKRLQRSLR